MKQYQLRLSTPQEPTDRKTFKFLTAALGQTAKALPLCSGAAFLPAMFFPWHNDMEM
jgi:hypothetical protein